MNNRQWLESVRRELVRRGLSPRAVGRMLEELRDHLLDLQEGEGQDTEVAALQRLGNPADLAQAAWENRAAASYVGRHPVVGFVLLPIPLTLLGWALMVAVTIGLFRLGDGLLDWPIASWPVAAACLMALIDFAVRIVPPVLAAVLCCFWARRSARGWKWNMAACLLIGAVAGLYHSTLQFPVEPGAGRWAIGLGAPGGQDQLLQLLVPLAIGLWGACRAEREALTA